MDKGNTNINNNINGKKGDQQGFFKFMLDEIKKRHKAKYDILNYNPDPEKIVRLHCNSEEERDEILKNPKFLDGNIFQLYIGKMQYDQGTLYNDTSLGIGFEYMINHTKEGEQSVVQICADVGNILHKGDVLAGNTVEQEDQPKVLSIREEKQHIEDFIKKKFKNKGKAIKVEIISDKYPKLFDALEKWVGIKEYKESDLKEGKKLEIPYKKPNLEDLKPEVTIIPCEKPNLDSMIPFKSPLQIIQYLAYHAKNDKKLMELFYNTKPRKYIGGDVIKKKKPGDQYVDFYGMIEVGLRLYEVLNGVSIQGGLGRQMVYDKIISMIINGDDNIHGKKEFDCKDKLFIENYPALQDLHKICKKNYTNVKFNQLYIELSGGAKGGLEETKIKLEKKSNIKSKRRDRIITATLAALVTIFGYHEYNNYTENKEQKQIQSELAEHAKSQSPDTEGPIYYREEINELITAFQLDKLDKNLKELITDNFNAYVNTHKTEGLTTEKLIQGYWRDYGARLIKNFRLNKPYSFITPELIDDTKNIGEELSFKPDYHSGNRLILKTKRLEDYGIFDAITERIDGYKKVLEYNDCGKKYYIVKVSYRNSGQKTQIYLAVKGDEIKQRFPKYSTDIFKEIQDTTGLDSEIVSNTNNLNGNFVIYGVDNYGIIRSNSNYDQSKLINTDENQIVKMSKLNYGGPTSNAVYVGNGEIYYFITVPTASGKKIGLASKTIDGTYTNTTFNEKIGKQFANARF